MSSSPRFAQFKLVLLGESAVGKSLIVHRFVKDLFDDLRESTIGAAFLTQTLTLTDTTPPTSVKFEIWDTAGQERYKSLAPMYYRNAPAAVVVYDVTSPQLLVRAENWVKELRKQAPDDIVIALAGNKVDLAPDADTRPVATATAEAYARENGLLFMEVSAKTGEGVRALFEGIARQLPVEEVVERVRAKRVDIGQRPSTNDGCGC